ncbi:MULTISPECIES: GntR family transcriptional regulator [Alkalihalophilus]|uniref:GntR family transcriptional regulator n=3 Tax=Alkalihalophilus TaxID=2893060 RepID=D3FVC9_ALKPO|nr:MULTISPECIES: GntR family transcriptional regulator [Alkalihalophilus]ADC50330.1 GntR family transcriptional regulator [Alkalihalophilus pseudofirmus OF4]ERN54931.1 transcriptional regulator [Alkalihalophilus marmarensis DSM 21297]MCM3489431.1 GntR family transcriptional regulator [Alkalihalophilus marmarensis]MDV2886878.1 GntR family transcriptional regulator [Alkalihalophilus pseudofirmus]MEC2072052.1 GntR family transcriptional regulator [Alkalihalophilus marmarensis]
MKLPISVQEGSRTPIYHQIEEQIKALIVSGHVSAGTPLPSIRALSKDLACSVITTRRAYQNLEQQGYIKTSQGRGTFVAEIDERSKKEAKTEAVYDTLKKAVEVGRRHSYTDDELRKLFEEALME